MGRTRAELAARLREGYEANNWGPALDVLGELEAPEAAPAVIADAGASGLSGGGAAAHDAEEAVEAEDDPDYPSWGEDSGPDRAGEDGEERPGLHHRTRGSRRPVRRKR